MPRASQFRFPLFCLLIAAATACGWGCQSTLPQDTKRIRDRYDAELATLKAQYEKDQLACDSTPNPQACKDQLAAAYREQLRSNWERENAEVNQAVRKSMKSGPSTPSN